MKVKDLVELGQREFGSQWKFALSQALGVSPALITKVVQEQTPLSPKLAQKAEKFSQKKANYRAGAARAWEKRRQSAVVIEVPEQGTMFQPAPEAVLELPTPVLEVTAGIDVAQIEAEINEKFAMMDRVVRLSLEGQLPAVIISGPPGLGKSFTVMKALKEYDKNEYDVISGSCTPVGLYKALYHMRDGGKVLIDDADSALKDDVALNLLKVALDMDGERVISWRSGASWVGDDESKGQIPNQFAFRGSVIFISNIDFQEQIDAGTNLSPHYEALISRAIYIDLGMRTPVEQIVRLKMLAREAGFFQEREITDETVQAEIMGFMIENADRLQEVSARILSQVVRFYKIDQENWKTMTKVTKFKRKR